VLGSKEGERVGAGVVSLPGRYVGSVVGEEVGADEGDTVGSMVGLPAL